MLSGPPVCLLRAGSRRDATYVPVITQPEDLLSSAGFRTKPAETATQKHQLELLPDGKMSVVRQNGKTYYVYGDRTHKQIYVGNRGQYQKFDGDLRRQPDADVIVKRVYNRRGHPVQVNEFHGFGPLGE